MWGRLRELGRRPDMWVVAAAAAGGAVLGAFMVRPRAGESAPVHSLRDVLDRLDHAGFSVWMLIALAMWLPVLAYWGLAARKAGARVRSEAAGSRLVHLVLSGAGQVLLFAPVPGLRGRVLPESVSLIAIGLTVEAASALLAVWARRTLGRNWSGAIASMDAHELVRSGPYRVVRHPIYTGLLGLCLGTAIVSGEVHALVGMALLAAAYWRKIRMEEGFLRAHFGAAYEEYRKQTWAVLPGVV